MEEICNEGTDQSFCYDAKTVVYSSYISQGLPEVVTHSLPYLHVWINIELDVKTGKTITFCTIFSLYDTLCDYRFLQS